MAREGQVLKALAEKPRLLPHLIETWRAFFTLSSTRMIGFGTLGPIPWTAVDAYANRYGIKGEAFERFHRFITAMDGIYLEIMGKKKASDGDRR